jgi:beta-glucosidase-like glycosyl hydrolase
VASYVPGLQNDAADPDHLKISACCKHYVAYSLEDYNSIDRHHFNANVTEQDMADTYLPAFEACASPSRGGGSCIMCSYNSVNGIPMCANNEYLDLARKEWKFDGYITSDCGAVEDVYATHYYASTPTAAVADVLKAGMDTECGSWFETYLKPAYTAGLIDEAVVDTALSNLFRVQMRLGRFDKNTSFNEIGLDQINSEANQALARDAARQAVVLLKNLDNKALPLSKDIGSVAVVGPNSDAAKTMLGNYEGIPVYIVTPLEGVQDVIGAAKVNYAMGCDISTVSTDGFAAATDAVSRSDAIIMFMGIDQSVEREGQDR